MEESALIGAYSFLIELTPFKRDSSSKEVKQNLFHYRKACLKCLAHHTSLKIQHFANTATMANTNSVANANTRGSATALPVLSYN